MTKIANALGTQYIQNKNKIFTRTFELGGHKFRVRIPYVHESDEIYKRINDPDAQAVEKAYQAMVEPLKEIENAETVFEFKDDDVLIDGRSIREAAKQKIQVETKITEYVKLLVPEIEGESLENLTYAEIEAEFPMAVQLQLLEKISEAISPTYKETRGN